MAIQILLLHYFFPLQYTSTYLVILMILVGMDQTILAEHHKNKFNIKVNI
jgi:hypothetical protein